MQLRPGANALTRLSRLDLPGNEIAVEIDLRLLPRMFRVKMRRLMLLLEHADHDAKERRDNGHVLVYPFASSERPHAPHQPRRRMIAPAAEGCMRMILTQPSCAYSLE